MYCELPKLGRCCFCMPLRQGLLTYGYISLMFSMLVAIVYSTPLDLYVDVAPLMYSEYEVLNGPINNAICFIDIVFSAILIYGAHKQIASCIRAYYYYTLATCCMMVLLTLFYMTTPYFVAENVAMSTTRWCLYFYLILSVRSYLERLQNTCGFTSKNHEEIVDGELLKKDSSINPSVPAETV